MPKKLNSNGLSIEQLKNLLGLEEYRSVINDDGSVAVPKSSIYNDLSNAMDASLRLQPKYIYTILKGNRYNIHSKILELYKIHQPVFHCKAPSDDSFDDVIRFTLNIQPIWNDIKTEEVIYSFKNRTRTIGTLKRKTWSNYLFERIYENTQINCPLSFKRCKISESGIALKVLGRCNECEAEFIGVLANDPEKNSDKSDAFLMDCSVQGFDSSFKHIKKRQLKGSKRVEIQKELIEGKMLPSIWRREKMDQGSNLGDKEPPHLFKLTTLSRAKNDGKERLLGIKEKDYCRSLRLMKYNPQYQGAIKSIGSDPLFVHYWTNEQIAVYQAYHDILCIDATGSLIKSVSVSENELSSHIYLYQAVTKIKSKSGPVFQMISSAQNTNTITYWLTEFLRIGSSHQSNFPLPKEVITDFDRALMGAVVKAFAKKDTLAEYLSTCFNLLKQNNTIIPSCLIRLDICHFMNMIAKWKFWHRFPLKVKQFYMRSIANLRNQGTIEGIEIYAKAIFIMALSTNLAPDSSSTEAREFLSMSIRGVDIEEKYLLLDKQADDDQNNEADEAELLSTNIFKWSSNIYTECKNTVEKENETSNVNGYFCAELANKLKTLLPYFPLFSEVMPACFRYGSERPTSAPVESEFNDLKHRVLRNHSKPMKVDHFIAHHITSFAGKLKLAVADTEENDTEPPLQNINNDFVINVNCNNTCNNECVTTLDDSSKDHNDTASLINNTNINNNYNDIKDNNKNYITTENKNVSSRKRKISNSNKTYVDALSEINFESNWRNKNKAKRPRRYCDPYPEFNPTLKNMASIPVIINGNYCKNVQDKKKIYVVNNTCAFDTACQILAMGISNDKNYHQLIKENPSPIHDCAIILNEYGLRTKFFKRRAHVLYDTLKQRSQCNPINVDGETNVYQLLEKMFVNIPSCVSFSICQICRKTNERVMVVCNVNHNILRKEGFKTLSKAIAYGGFERHNRCCGHKQNVTRQYGPTVIVDTDVGEKFSTALGDIPMELMFEDIEKQKYANIGVIAYTGAYNPNIIGHYTAYVKIIENWFKFDGNSCKPKSEIVSAKETIDAHMCIYAKKI